MTLKCSFFRAKFEFVYFMKTSQQSKKGLVECATPKENINRISAVDEEHFLVSCWQYSLIGTQTLWCPLFNIFSDYILVHKKKIWHPGQLKGLFSFKLFSSYGGPRKLGYLASYIYVRRGLCCDGFRSLCIASLERRPLRFSI